MTLKELYEATLAKYENVDERSTEDLRCVYSHHRNGVGCAIGCHLPPKLAAALDAYDDATIELVYPKRPRTFVKYFPGISVEELTALQKLHDKADDVKEFRTALRRKIRELSHVQDRTTAY